MGKIGKTFLRSPSCSLIWKEGKSFADEFFKKRFALAQIFPSNFPRLFLRRGRFFATIHLFQKG
jgi:hypothetical protein